MAVAISTQEITYRYDSDIRAICFALFLSIVLHLCIVRALPWLETVNSKPPLNIIAEFQTLAPPPPPPVEAKPLETTVKPEVVKAAEPPAPTTKTHAVAVPVLSSENVVPDSNYNVPDIPMPATLPNLPSPVAAPEAQPKESSSTASASSSSKTTSSSSWDDSEVWDEYGSNLQKLCERNKQYPAIAIRRGYQGSGKVLVRFSAEGKTNSVSMEVSTGQKSLDDQAIEMVKKSVNELPVPAKFRGREFRISIPVDFKLE